MPEVLEGRYEIGEQIGVGAVGEVHVAWDRQNERTVAVKIVQGFKAGQTMIRERFQREARSLAKISHPNVVTLHSYGEDEDRMYMIMEYVKGRTYADVICDPLVDRPIRLRLLEQAARGIHFVNEQGVIHRDLKPTNILITPQNDVKVVDFGLAHLDEGETRLTKTGAMLGTPMYMAPEQVKGKTAEVRPTTDVFALGVMLYESLTAQLPHPGETQMEVYESILNIEPVSPDTKDPAIPVRLAAIAMKAIEKNPANRYATAGEFADDLRRFLDGESVEARPLSLARTLMRRGRKHRLWIVSGIAASVTLAFIAWVVIGKLRDRWRIERAVAEAKRVEEVSDPEKALASWLAVLALDPDHPGAREGRARTQLAVERREEAVRRGRAFEEANRILERAGSRLDRGQRYLFDEDADFAELRKNAGKARDLIAEAIRTAPTHARAHLMMGNTLALLGDWKGAEAALRDCVRLAPEFGPGQYHLGRILLLRTFLARVRGSIGHVPDADNPEDLARDARAAFEAARREGSGFDDEVENEVARAMEAYIGGNDVGARAHAENALKRFGKRDGVEELLFICGLAGPAEDQIPWLDKAIRIRPNYLAARMLRANLRGLEGDAKGEKEDYDHLIRMFPDLPFAYSGRGARAALRGDFDAAFPDLDRVIQLRPKDPIAYYNRGYALFLSGEPEDALEDYAQALKLHPDYAQAFHVRAEAKMALGDMAGALSDTAEAIRRDPENAAFLRRRGVLHLQAGRLRLADKDFTACHRLKPDDPLYLVDRGVTHTRMEDWKQAVSDFEEALKRAPPDWGARGRVEQMLEQARRFRDK